MIRRAGCGPRRGASAPQGRIIPQRCCPTARCSSQRDDSSGGDLASAELYDPASGMWTRRAASIPERSAHTATCWPTARCSSLGGDDNGVLASAELYDPATGTWAATGSLATPRNYHTATLLPNGLVLVAGGFTARAISRARNWMIRRPGSGARPAASHRPRFWAHGDLDAQRQGPGGRYRAPSERRSRQRDLEPPPAASALPACGPRRPYCLTERCSSQEETAAAAFSRARNSTLSQQHRQPSH